MARPMACWSPSFAGRRCSKSVGSETPSTGVRHAVQALTRGNVSESDSCQPQASSLPKRGEAASSRGGEKRPSLQITLSNFSSYDSNFDHVMQTCFPFVSFFFFFFFRSMYEFMLAMCSEHRRCHFLLGKLIEMFTPGGKVRVRGGGGVA